MTNRLTGNGLLLGAAVVYPAVTFGMLYSARGPSGLMAYEPAVFVLLLPAITIGGALVLKWRGWTFAKGTILVFSCWIGLMAFVQMLMFAEAMAGI